MSLSISSTGIPEASWRLRLFFQRFDPCQNFVFNLTLGKVPRPSDRSRLDFVCLCNEPDGCVRSFRQKLPRQFVWKRVYAAPVIHVVMRDRVLQHYFRSLLLRRSAGRLDYLLAVLDGPILTKDFRSGLSVVRL
jgi:hypothetical protein